MLKDEVALYSKLTGNDGMNTPIAIIGAYLDGYDKGKAEQPKTGKWISADAIFGGVPFYCSECGENTRDTVMGKPRYNFCPMCGAKMEGADDE